MNIDFLLLAGLSGAQGRCQPGWMAVTTSWTTEARDVWEERGEAPSADPHPVLRTACGSAVVMTIWSGMEVSGRPSFSAGVGR